MSETITSLSYLTSHAQQSLTQSPHEKEGHLIWVTYLENRKKIKQVISIRTNGISAAIKVRMQMFGL